MNKNGYFRCENCGHYQYTTEFGECEECGYENLIPINKKEYEKGTATDEKIARCIECKNMKIVSIENGCGASAKCFKKSKRGKSITWAMTGICISPDNNWKKEEGKDRVIESLNSKKIAPSWCPIRKNKCDK